MSGYLSVWVPNDNGDEINWLHSKQWMHYEGTANECKMGKY